jgi:nitrate/TMAO reductase-like tetraheme cytochrome c subunit
MAMTSQKTGWLASVSSILLRNGIVIFGTTMTTISAIAIFVLTAMTFIQDGHSAYLGILTFMVLPGFFIFGLALIPVGILWDKLRGKTPEEREQGAVFVIDLRNSRTRRTIGVFLFLTVVNVFVISAVSYEGVHYSESVEFCGTVCHTVMEPEYTAYLGSPHSEVTCAECHIGPGASWFVKSKLSGVRQVFAVMFDTYHKPIQTPVENLRPAQETCEQCHWPEKFTGDRVQVNTKFAEDEANTKLSTVLVMHIGGGNAHGRGIHNWHINPDRTTMYLPATHKKEEIPLVRVRESDGTVHNYVSDAFEGDPDAIPDSALEVMDCVDCHNRPTHIYHMPDEAMDMALDRGAIDPGLPYIKMVGLESLQAATEEEDPEAFIRQYITSHYEENSNEILTAQGEQVEQAISEVQAIFRRNVFPEMKVTWGTYANNIGHTQSPGCFRCHDDAHATPAGDIITQDCTICHNVLAWDEENPEVLEQLGLN